MEGTDALDLVAQRDRVEPPDQLGAQVGEVDRLEVVHEPLAPNASTSMPPVCSLYDAEAASAIFPPSEVVEPAAELRGRVWEQGKSGYGLAGFVGLVIVPFKGIMGIPERAEQVLGVETVSPRVPRPASGAKQVA